MKFKLSNKKLEVSIPEERWQEASFQDHLMPLCPHCAAYFRPRPDAKDHIKKCESCGEKFQYWATYYTVTKVRAEQ